MASYLAECLDSVLCQSGPQLEAMVIDDGSQDDTPEVVSEYLAGGRKHDARVRYIRQENAGKLAALNRGISQARGDLFCILDADDTFTPRSLEARAKALQANPQAVGVYADAHYMDINGRVYRTRSSRPVKRRRELVASMIVPIIGASLMVRRKVMLEVAPLDTSFVRSDDAYINMEVFARGELIYLPEAVLNYRNYPRSNNLKLRVLSAYHLCRIIRRYYSGITAYYLMGLQIAFAALKFCYELVSPKK
jgi:glycosyltransferase involved in cell wall biosynthesis